MRVLSWLTSGCRSNSRGCEIRITSGFQGQNANIECSTAVKAFVVMLRQVLCQFMSIIDLESSGVSTQMCSA